MDDFFGEDENGFSDPPETVAENVERMREIQRLRRIANRGVAEKNDTERYLVLVYRSREDRESALRFLGLPTDERYLCGHSCSLKLIDGDALVRGERVTQAAAVESSGAGG